MPRRSPRPARPSTPANPQAGRLVRAIFGTIDEVGELVAGAVETGRFDFFALSGLVDNVKEIIDAAQDL